MNKKEIENFVYEHINIEELIEYLTGDYGQRFCLDKDGKTYLLQIGTYAIEPEEREISSAPCIGIGNIDISPYAEGWTTWDDEINMYCATDTNEMLDTEEIIIRCCQEGDMEEDLISLREALIDNWSEDLN